MSGDDWQKTDLKTMKVRPPFSPSPDDGRIMLNMTAPALAARAQSAVLVLGVTPLVVQLGWPAGTTITAVDASPGMIASTWQPHPTLPSEVTCASWQDLPFEAGTFDAVVGDGSLNSVPSLDAYRAILDQMARVLKPDGMLVLRFFLGPEPAETPERVITLAREGAFPTTAAFRLRFAFSLTGENSGVPLSAMHQAFDALVPDRDGLAAETGWPRADIDRIDMDKDSRVRFTFPTQAKLASLCDGVFSIARMERGNYTQSDYCPTVLFKPVR